MSNQTTINTILHGDAFAVLKNLPDTFIQTCITSPPYYGLRDYGIEGQIGLEETPEAYVEKLVQVFREVRRVLRDDGTLWVNIGDSYCGYKGDKYNQTGHRGTGEYSPVPISHNLGTPHTSGVKNKDLIGIPWMVAFALRSDRWYLRSDCIWSKPNAMPESVIDRPTKSHEYLFLLSKSSSYFYDADAIREPLIYPDRIYAPSDNHKTLELTKQGNRTTGGLHDGRTTYTNPLGRNKRTVFTVASQPFPESHFATFPPKLIEPCILAGTSPRACEYCGSPWERVTERGTPPPEPVHRHPEKRLAIGQAGNVGEGNMGFRASRLSGQEMATWKASHPDIITGWRPTCTCTNEGTGTCIVLDPFMGAGTTALVALLHHRDYLGIELNQDYITMAKKRIATVPQVLWTGESEAVS